MLYIAIKDCRIEISYNCNKFLLKKENYISI